MATQDLKRHAAAAQVRRARPQLSLSTPPSGVRRVRGAVGGIRFEMALVQFAAVAASLALFVVDGRDLAGVEISFSVVVLLGLGLLRVLTAGVSLATSTLLLEPIGVVVMLSGTGGAASPFLPMALAGIWWAARSGRGRPTRAFRILRESRALRLDQGTEVEIGHERPTSLAYGIALAVAYCLLIVPVAVRDGMPAEAIEDGIVLFAGWLLAEVAVRLVQAADAVRQAPAASIPARGDAELKFDPAESHLLACLALGLTNRQIAEVMQVSVGRVRYRLTLVYRTLGVEGRAQAVERAREMQVTIPIDQRGTGSPDADGSELLTS
jgi:DNA-binding CsgD family transcriptional regulator